ncbi:hypothetical protein EC835_101718 [Providencia alcalifaciens]|uniref:Uncharacterized protein n=1 Tax=Providencia alcalifaciens TaxID=126385 RepID=A0A4R3NX63_9GAMM|nr:hypothetical protein EC835_101718 [Providencia alcalifaciens]
MSILFPFFIYAKGKNFDNKESGELSSLDFTIEFTVNIKTQQFLLLVKYNFLFIVYDLFSLVTSPFNFNHPLSPSRENT